jgi:hypothetical protein
MNYLQNLFTILFKIQVKEDSTIDFVASLSECRHWISSGGKSGMTFYKTEDDRFALLVIVMI